MEDAVNGDQSEIAYRDLFDNNPNPMWIYDRETLAFMVVNNAAIVHYGYSREEFLSMTIKDIRPAEDVAAFLKVIARTPEGLDKVPGTWRHRKKDGAIMDVQVTSHTMVYEGRPADLVVVHDVTESQRAFREAKLNEERLRILLELSNMSEASLPEIAQFVLDKALELTNSDIGFVLSKGEEEGVFKQLAWSKKVMSECTVTDQPIHLPIEKAGLWGEAIRRKAPIVVDDYSLPHPAKKGIPEGHLPLRRILCVPVLEVDTALGAAAVGNKDSAYTEEDARHLSLLMSGMWRHIYRTGIEEERLRRQRVEELDHLKNVFIASMSHELRTPLNSVLGFTGTILQGITGEITEETRTQLEMVRESGKQLLTLVNDVIDLSTIEADKLKLEMTEFDLGRLLVESARSYQGVAEEKGVALEVESPDSLSLKSDRVRIGQMLTNLIANAVKFTDAGTVTISVEREEGLVKIAVADTGRGLRQEDLTEVFLPFQKVRGEGRGGPEGSGLGLHISRKLARRLGGELSVKSEYGKGSTFTFCLPVS